MRASSGRGVDAEFTSLPLSAVADAALAAARAAGADYAQLRVQRAVTQRIRLRDGVLEAITDAEDLGLAVRVIVDGAWGFASHTAVRTDSAAQTARQAVAVARTLRGLQREPVDWAAEPVYQGAQWVSGYLIDPFEVPIATKVALLQQYSRILSDAAVVTHVSARLWQVKEQFFVADTAGSSITQQRVHLEPTFEAIAVPEGAGGFETMKTLAPPTGRGWEYLTDDIWDWERELGEIPELLSAKLAAPSVIPGPTDLVLDPTNLWLTIHESIGHATEYDRAIGYESAYAGTSFATPEGLGSLRYGSEIMHVTADRIQPHGLATIGYDHEAVATGRWDLIRDGILVGYQLDRAFAPKLGLTCSNGCSYADAARHVPIQRMANVSLQPDPTRDTTTEELIERVDEGIYVVGDKSWSIDMQRYNFQFTGQRFYRIHRGRLVGQVRDVAYQATTTDFWGAMEAVGGRSTWRLGGTVNCGKAQPGQVAPVSHGCPSVLVRGVNVLNTRAEAGQ